MLLEAICIFASVICVQWLHSLCVCVHACARVRMCVRVHVCVCVLTCVCTAGTGERPTSCLTVNAVMSKHPWEAAQ